MLPAKPAKHSLSRQDSPLCLFSAQWGTLTPDRGRKFYSEIIVEIQAFSSLFQSLDLSISTLMCMNDGLFSVN